MHGKEREARGKCGIGYIFKTGRREGGGGGMASVNSKEDGKHFGSLWVDCVACTTGINPLSLSPPAPLFVKPRLVRRA